MKKFLFLAACISMLLLTPLSLDAATRVKNSKANTVLILVDDEADVFADINGDPQTHVGIYLKGFGNEQIALAIGLYKNNQPVDYIVWFIDNATFDNIGGNEYVKHAKIGETYELRIVDAIVIPGNDRVDKEICKKKFAKHFGKKYPSL